MEAAGLSGGSSVESSLSSATPQKLGSVTAPSHYAQLVYAKVIESVGTLPYDPKVKPSTTYITFCSIARPIVKEQNPEMPSPAILAVSLRVVTICCNWFKRSSESFGVTLPMR